MKTRISSETLMSAFTVFWIGYSMLVLSSGNCEYYIEESWQTYLKRTPERTVLLASDRARGFLEGTDGENELKERKNG